MDIILDRLIINVDYYRWKYETSHHFFKGIRYDEFVKAKDDLRYYISKNYPKVKAPAYKNNYVMLADLTEQFENYE